MSTTVTVIAPNAGAREAIRELWRGRDLVVQLAQRDLKVRYRQTAVGAAWAVLQPLILAGVLTIFLGMVARLPSNDLPYPLLVLSGVTIWTFFVATLNSASNSVVANPTLVTKVRLPRLALPVSASLPPVVDVALATIVLSLVAVATGRTPNLQILWLVPCLALTWLLAASIGTALAAINVRYRDVKYATPFLLQVWFFTSPVVYGTDLVPDRLTTAYHLNPMVGLVGLFRAATVASPIPEPRHLALSISVTGLLSLIGIRHFGRAQERFADEI